MAPRFGEVARRVMGGALAACGLLALAASPSPSHPDVPAAVPPRVEESTLAFERVGNAGCSASACHGGPAASLTAPIDTHGWESSATHWQARDPHARAYDALKSPIAAEMMARLRLPKLGGGVASATESDRCLACHTDPQLVGKPDVPASVTAQGIGCEACHGNAGGYLRAHTTWRTPADRAAGYAATGLAPLFDLGARAATCARCHVGSPANPGVPGGSAVRRDMNHDLIAAGHPPLDGFDFAEAQRRLTPHWFEKDRTRPDAEWRAWLVGRVAFGEAAARLLADRAAHGTWPELAESQCVGCHQTVPTEKVHAVGRRLGALRWQSAWPLTSGGVAEASELAALAAWLDANRSPSQIEVTKRAAAAAAQLAAWRDELSRADADLRPLARRVLPPTAAGLDDRDATHLLRGLAALREARR